ncbi:hypothetical protein GUITHDRAFT_112504 [Guillardia theta CCMP2712]|uniref:Uncharacterized protein n=1 Tax=Guillardia theta (strain CCMP2712) TaxID=905079 RepID=L1J0B4_GUITC|nr:hypothetical protein GUITHDRAFT_112504 [Guillardia theta CCMP2712]EKX41530.1 hypothetical protein GUITHDRAFT_112504 [Guillardia theta CCMP2712]|eukprot:XP_005828510.1 hypothetical protein GUITHDRAFT_112504 [Guillardia theta CCMP2712]
MREIMRPGQLDRRSRELEEGRDKVTGRGHGGKTAYLIGGILRGGRSNDLAWKLNLTELDEHAGSLEWYPMKGLEMGLVEDGKTSLASAVERAGLGIACLDGFIFTVGGFQKGGAHIKTTEVFDARGRSARAQGKEKKTSKAPPRSEGWHTAGDLVQAREGMGIAAGEGFVWVAGGYDGNERLKSVERLSPQTLRWTRMSPMHYARHTVGLAVMKGKLYAVGGWSAGEEGRVERHAFGLLTFGDFILVVGGLTVVSDRQDVRGRDYIHMSMEGRDVRGRLVESAEVLDVRDEGRGWSPFFRFEMPEALLGFALVQ